MDESRIKLLFAMKKPKEEAAEEGHELSEAALAILTAIKENDTKALGEALKGFVKGCSYED